MRTYVLFTAILLDVIALAQLTRFLMRVPITVAGFDVPVWASGLAFLLAGSLGAWGMVLLAKTRGGPAPG